ncbi:MAG TPA: zf-HC2 domain-containing protein, partial [Thermoanaerobaculia bacterium]|nr:zf-HC2 domain-containing protein [Thermoanaerobaculia bacterium]
MSSQTTRPDCPADDVLASFVDGSLTPEEASAVIDHLDLCERCSAIVAGTMRVNERLTEAASATKSVRQRDRMNWLPFAAAASFVLALGGTTTWWLTRPSLAPLVADSKRLSHRPLEPRVSGLPWARFEKDRGDQASEPNLLRLQGDAGQLMQKTEGASDARRLHMNAVATLLAGDADSAVKKLESLTSSNTDHPQFWNDLAAARLTVASRQEDSQMAALALADADHALRLDPQYGEALFNRALALERLGLKHAATKAWDHYLSLDPNSKWADDARRHRQNLAVVTRSSVWKKTKPQLEAAVAEGDKHRVGEIVRLFPQDARLWCEWSYLGQWAEAHERGDDESARRFLDVARAVGNELPNLAGESLLHDAVAAIDAAAQSPSRTSTLAAAHRVYYRARILYSDRQVVESLPLFRQAADFFGKGSSPMHLVAEYYIANALHDSGHHDDSLALLHDLEKDLPEHYEALRAQINWELGTVLARTGRLPESLDAYLKALDGFVRLGETDNANSMRGMAAGDCSPLGRSAEAWRLLTETFHSMSDSGDLPRMQVALSGAARTEVLHRRWDLATSLYSILLDTSVPIKNPRLHADAVLWQSVALHSIGSDVDDLSASRAAAHAVSDPALRDASVNDLRSVEARHVRESDAARAEALLTHYLETAAAGKNLLHLPEAYLERAQDRRAMQKDEGAIEDLRTSLAMLDRSIQPGNDSPDSDTARRASLELIDILDSHDRHDEAFAAAEDARRRAQLARLGGAPGQASSPSAIAQHIPRGTLLLNYVALWDRLIIYSLDAHGLKTQRVAISSQAIGRDAEELRNALRDRSDERALQIGGQLYKSLIEPIERSLPTDGTIVVISDPPFAQIPFAMLRPDEQSPFLVERTAIVAAPSAGSYLRALQGSGRKIVPATALIIGNPAFDRQRFPKLATLDQAAQEAVEVGRLYPGATVLVGKDATKQATMERLPSASLIHVASHAIDEGNRSSQSSIILANSSNDSGTLSATEIARLNLGSTILAVLA